MFIAHGNGEVCHLVVKPFSRSNLVSTYSQVTFNTNLFFLSLNRFAARCMTVAPVDWNASCGVLSWGNGVLQHWPAPPIWGTMTLSPDPADYGFLNCSVAWFFARNIPCFVLMVIPIHNAWLLGSSPFLVNMFSMLSTACSHSEYLQNKS